MSEWINRCVDSVDDLLKLFRHCGHLKLFSWLCTARCWARLTACPNVLLHDSHAKGRVPVCDRRT